MYVGFLSQFFDQVVPAYDQYVALSKNDKLKKAELYNAALNTASLLFHFREALEYLYPKDTFRRNDVVGLCPDYNWIGDVCNATKHSELTRTNRIIKDKSHIEETLMHLYYPFQGETLYPRKFFGVIQVRIIINPLPKMGDPRDLLEISTNVINFWSNYLVTNNLTNKRLLYRYESDDIIIRRKEEAKDSSMSLHPQYDNVIRTANIGKMYEPKINAYQQIGFTKDGQCVVQPLSERPDLYPKIYGQWDLSKNP